MHRLRYIMYSVLLHVVAGGLLVFSLDYTPANTIKPVASPQIVKAVAVDNKQVEKELQRLQDIENDKLKKQKELERKLKELEQKKAQTEKQRKAEEKKLADAKKKKAREEANRREEQKKIARLKKEQDELEKKKQKAEEERKEAERKKREAEEERRRLEKEAAERKRKEEAERKRKEEEKRRQEEQKRREAELAEEQRLLEAEQARQDQGIINQYGLRIRNAIEQSFNTAGLPPGLSCVLQIRMIPGGDVVEARVVKTSGNNIFDRRAETAVNKASPLPVPDNPRQFEKMRELRLTFAPQN